MLFWGIWHIDYGSIYSIMQIMTGLVGESVWKVNCAPDCALAVYIS